MYKTKKTQHPRRPLAIDFDGVIHGYSKGFLDGTIYDKPIAQAKTALTRLSKNYFIYIYSARSKTRAGREAIEGYLKKYKISFDKIVAYKPPARFFIDDGQYISKTGNKL